MSKNQQIVELERKFNNLAVAKLSTDFSQAVSEDEKNVILKNYSETQAQSAENMDKVRYLTTEKFKHERLLLEAQHTIKKLSERNEKLGQDS